MYNWETVGRTMLLFFNLHTLNKGFHWHQTLLSHQPPVPQALESLDLIKSFTLFWYNFNFWKICWTRTKLLFLLLQVSWAINIQKNEVILKTYSIVDTQSQYERFLARFFFVVDRYARQIHRAMKTFYNFCNFNVLGIV